MANQGREPGQELALGGWLTLGPSHLPSQCFQLKGALPAPRRGEQSVGLSSACQGPEPRALSSSEGGHVRARQELWKRNVA